MNDFRESLLDHKISNGWFHYNTSKELLPTPYEVTWYRRLANVAHLRSIYTLILGEVQLLKNYLAITQTSMKF